MIKLIKFILQEYTIQRNLPNNLFMQNGVIRKFITHYSKNQVEIDEPY